MVKITYKGRPFKREQFMEDIKAKMFEAGIAALEEKARGAAATIVDPETGRHADVFVDRAPDLRVVLRTSGSPAFARLIEERLGVELGSVRTDEPAEAVPHPRVYLAHASEDKAIVRPIAEYLMANGVEVWFDEWDIQPGDSLRQEMEKGLGWMTHFAVILTPVSLTKPWVAREIDAGIVSLVGGKSRMVPLRVGTTVGELPIFLQTLLCEALDPSNENELKALVGRFHGVSRKPPLGTKPTYVRTVPSGLGGWSEAAVAIGRHLVLTSEHGRAHDPIVTVDDLIAVTGLARDDVRVAVLDLKEAGYLWEGSLRGHYAAEKALFVDFDEAFMPFSPKADALVVANRMVSSDEKALSTKTLAEEFDWKPRRMNSAICYLERAGVIETRHALASGPWRAVHLIQTDRTLRFARARA